MNEQPCDLIFLGFEVGKSVITGRNLQEGDILLQALKDFGTPEGRSSWDAMLVMAGLLGEQNDSFEFVRGEAFIDEQGKNYFQKNENGEYNYIVAMMDFLESIKK